MGSAICAGIRLSMKPPVVRIIVFGLTGRTHFKMPHGSFGSIVGNIVDDGIAGPAVGAVDKRIVIAPVSGVKEFGQAIAANRNVRRNQGGGFRPAFAFCNGKTGVISYGVRLAGNFNNVGKRWALDAKIRFKRSNLIGKSLNVDGYT